MITFYAYLILYLKDIFLTAFAVTSFWNSNKSTVCQLLPSSANWCHNCETFNHVLKVSDSKTIQASKSALTWAQRESILISVPSPALSFEKIFNMSVEGSLSNTGSLEISFSISSNGFVHPILSDFRNLKRTKNFFFLKTSDFFECKAAKKASYCNCSWSTDRLKCEEVK